MTPRLFFAALRSFRRGDIAIVVTNPPLLPFAIHAAARLRGASVVLLVHDVFPETAILAGVLGANGVPARIWRVANDWLIRRMDRIVVLGRDTLELIARRVPAARSRLAIIGNWADIDDVTPADAADNSLLRSLGLEDRFVLGYAGNMGRNHDIEMLLAAADRLRTAAPDVHLLFVGTGAKDAQIRAAAARDSSNVTLVGPMDRDQQQVFLNACHVAVMALTPGMAGVGVPSRLYNVLASGRPVVAAVDRESEPALVLEEENVGRQVPPSDVAKFVDAVVALRADPTYLREAGERARSAATRRFAFPQVVQAYRTLLRDMGWPEVGA